METVFVTTDMLLYRWSVTLL